MKNIAFDRYEDWIPLTSVKMARSRGRRDDSGIIINQPINGRDQFDHQRKPPKWRALIIVLIIVFLAILILLVWSWGSLTIRLQKYTSFTRAAEVAELSVQKSREGEDQLRISLTFVDAKGYYKPENKPHLINGDKVLLQFEYILVPSWLEPLGLHSGYILISLDGQNTNGTRVFSWKLNEADNDSSIPAQLYAFWISPRYGSITLLPSRSIYKLCITPTGLLKQC